MKYIKLFEELNNYKIEIFNQKNFSNFIYSKFRHINIANDIKYFDYDNLSDLWGSKKHNSSIRFIVAYNDNNILGIIMLAYWELQEHYSVSYISTNKNFRKTGISIKLINKLFEYFSTHHKNEILYLTGYSIDGWKYLRKYILLYSKKYNVEIKEKAIEYIEYNVEDDRELFNQSRKEIQQLYPGTYENNNLNIINLIKDELLKSYDYENWNDFIDEQEMGDCQMIVHTIKNMNITGVKTHFGEIQIDEPTEEEYFDKIMTHHWISYNNEILEFSKGTLKDYVHWNNIYNINNDGEIIYKQINIK